MPAPNRQVPLELESLASEAAWVRRLAMAVARDTWLAEDLSQETWLAVLRRQGAQGGEFRSWCAAVTRNLARLSARGERRRRERELLAARPERQEDPTLALQRLEMQESLLRAVRDLDEPYRTSVLLRWFEGLEPREIAGRSGIPVRTVHTRITRALGMLREKLDRESQGDRTKWLSAWIPLVSKPGWSWPWTVLMVAKLKVAIVGGVLAVGITTLLIALHREAPLGTGITGLKEAATWLDRPLESAPWSVSSATALQGGGRTVAALPDAPEPSAPLEADRPRSVAGVVLDLSGKTLAGVEVLFLGSGMSDPSSAPRSRSDGRGHFDLEADQAQGVLMPADERWTTVYEPHVRVPDPAEGYVLVLALRTTLKGRVTDSVGRPIQAADVRIEVPGVAHGFDQMWFDHARNSLGVPMDSSVALAWSARTAADGSFLIEPAPGLSSAAIRASAPGFATKYQALPEGQGEVIFVLDPASDDEGWLVGKVVDPSGKPVEHAFVILGSQITRSGSAGEFRLDLREHPRSQNVVAVKEGWQPAVQACMASFPDAPGAWPDPLVLRLEERALSIRGRTVDGEGRALAGVEVRALDPLTVSEVLAIVHETPPEGGHAASVVLGGGPVSSGSDGKFELLGLLPRNYRLRALHRESLAVVVSDPVAAGADDVVLRIADDDRAGVLAGKVLDLQGKPIAGAYIRARRTVPSQASAQEAVEGQPSRTDDAGKFEVKGVSTAIDSFYVQIEQDAPGRFLPIDPAQDRRELRLVVGHLAHVQVEIATVGLQADQVSLLDPQGRMMQIGARRGDGSWIGGDTLPLVRGRTEAFIVSEEAATLILLRGGKEVSRMPVRLVPGSLNAVRV